MPDRETALRTIGVGNIFHARSPNGASLVCLVTSVSINTIYARRITTQEDLEFDRQTGIESGKERILSRIDSVAPLPADVHDVFVELDRKYRIERDPERLKLTASEKRALLFLDSHYPSNPV